MKSAITVTFVLLSLTLYAQQDEYFEAFSLAYTKLQESTQEYVNFLSDNKIDSSCVALEEITRQYRTMLKLYDEIAFKYRHDASFDTLSRPIYTATFEEIDTLLQPYALLVQMKTMVQVMVDIEREGFPKNDRKVVSAIEALYFQDYFHPNFLDNSLEGNILRKQLQGMRAYIARKYR
ncbi:MAG: hypothetical protein FWH23_02180 [Bacteroidales bacterium]|nr:hypothetical protein [Bacteroidales bacterium]